jgi:hypothetical protein
MVGHAPRNSWDMKTLFSSPQSMLWRIILVAQVFNLCQRRLYREKLLGHVEQAPSPALEKNSRGRLSYIFHPRGWCKMAMRVQPALATTL